MTGKKLQGQSAVITGAARGIGFAIADALADEGAALTLADADEALVRESAAKIAESGVRAIAVKADVSNPSDCRAVIDKAVDEFGKIDILVNNAGITRDNLVLRMSEEDWDAVVDVNLKGAFLMSRAAIKPMLKSRRGRIVNISSVVGQSGNAGQANYSASKSGLLGLTKSMARELAGRNILVNAVSPGFVNTGMTDNLKEEVKAKLRGMIPLGRFADAIDIGRAVLFLVSEDSSYITGQTLAVNGGMYL